MMQLSVSALILALSGVCGWANLADARADARERRRADRSIRRRLRSARRGGAPSTVLGRDGRRPTDDPTGRAGVTA